MAAGGERWRDDGGVGRANCGPVRVAVGDLGIFPAAQERDADRGLAAADPLVKCRVFEAFKAWQVFPLSRYEWDAPQTPGEGLLRADEREPMGALVKRRPLLLPSERDQPFGTEFRNLER